MSLRASTISGARSSIMLAASNAGSTMLSAFAAVSWTPRSGMIHISVQTTTDITSDQPRSAGNFRARLHFAKVPATEVVLIAHCMRRRLSMTCRLSPFGWKRSKGALMIQPPCQSPSTTPAGTTSHKPYDKQQHNGPDRCIDDCADDADAEMNAQLW